MCLKRRPKVHVWFILLATRSLLLLAQNDPPCGELSDFTEYEKRGLTLLHNEQRRGTAGNKYDTGISQKGSNLRFMEWIDDVAEAAKKRLRYCDLHHCMRECDAERRAGEPCNAFFYDMKERYIQGDDDFLSAQYRRFLVRLSASAKFNDSLVQSYKHMGGHSQISQIIWASTWQLGCAKSSHRGEDDPEEEHMLILCLYCPGGNIEDRPIFTFGEPCSNCPSNFSDCDPETTMYLCKLKEPSSEPSIEFKEPSTEFRKPSTEPETTETSTELTINFSIGNILCQSKALLFIAVVVIIIKQLSCT